MIDLLSQQVNVIARAVRNVALSTDKTVIGKALDRMEKSQKQNEAPEAQLSLSTNSVKAKDLIAARISSSKAYFDVQQKALVLLAASNTDEAKTLILGDMRTKQTAVFSTLNDLSEYQRGMMEGTARESAASYHRSMILLALLSVAALTLSLAATLLITGSVLRQLGGEPQYAMDVATSIA